MIIIWTYGNQRQTQWTGFAGFGQISTWSTGDGGAIPTVTTRRQRKIPALLNQLKRRGRTRRYPR